MLHPSDPPLSATDDDAASQQQATEAYCWVLRCYLRKQDGRQGGEQGPTIESLLVPAMDSSQLMCDVNRWIGTKDKPTSDNDMTTGCELVWVIRGQPFTDANDKEVQLKALRMIALDIMSSDREKRL